MEKILSKNYSLETYIHSRNRNKLAIPVSLTWSKFVGACLEMFEENKEFRDMIIKKTENY